MFVSTWVSLGVWVLVFKPDLRSPMPIELGGKPIAGAWVCAHRGGGKGTGGGCNPIAAASDKRLNTAHRLGTTVHGLRAFSSAASSTRKTSHSAANRWRPLPQGRWG